MNAVKFGVAYEGGNDGDVILVWAKRLLAEKGLILDPKSILLSNGTSILGFINSYIKNFERNSIDIAIFCTDQDKDPDSRRRQIIEKITTKNLVFASKAVSAVPCPHIEKWLLIQDSVIKNILGINGEESLPHKDESPKNCFMSLYNEAEGYMGSQQQLRLEIAEQMDFGYCTRNNPEFNHFVQDLRSAINNL